MKISTIPPYHNGIASAREYRKIKELWGECRDSALSIMYAKRQDEIEKELGDWLMLFCDICDNDDRIEELQITMYELQAHQRRSDHRIGGVMCLFLTGFLGLGAVLFFLSL